MSSAARSRLSVLVIIALLVSLSGCFRYYVDISKHPRVADVSGKCFRTTRQLMIYRNELSDPTIYIGLGEPGYDGGFIEWVPQGTEIKVAKVMEYHHPINGVFYAPLLEGSLGGRHFAASGWSLFIPAFANEELKPDPKQIRLCD